MEYSRVCERVVERSVSDITGCPKGSKDQQSFKVDSLFPRYPKLSACH